ncbi:uncharacterized protein LOC110268505 [Arachis ipaensis]|uniref:uncharacterized protein LOC110268505 n=1 Tax=Arachis ipaensis TaxID=130454 RepID=UPI000A2B2FB4|nr:uncharacterized protein LOC110268505 [Arachis ipaensis]
MGNSVSSSVSSTIPNPFFLSFSDQPGLILVTQQLNEDNYHSWSRAMQKALNAKLKLGFITGSILQPDPDAEPEKFENWQCVNDMIPLKNWNDLKDRFQHDNGPRVFELKRELMNLRQEALSISQYFTKIKVLWEELNSYRPVQCNCGDARTMQEFLQAEYVHCFLMGLDESYS